MINKQDVLIVFNTCVLFPGCTVRVPYWRPLLVGATTLNLRALVPSWVDPYHKSSLTTDQRSKLLGERPDSQTQWKMIWGLH